MTQLLTIASIVEGQGEVAALPPLVRRISREIFGVEVQCLTPHRLPRSKFGDTDAFRNAVNLQARRVSSRGGVIIVLDSDDDDAGLLRDELLSVARPAAGAEDLVEVAVAVREYESWFLASMTSLRSHRSIKDDAEYSGDPERRRNCKKLLEEQMVESYKEIRHQVAFSSLLDVKMASKSSPSFERFVEGIGALIAAADARALKELEEVVSDL